MSRNVRDTQEGLSQSSGVYGRLGMPADFVTSELEVGHDPQRPCRAAAASVQA